MSAINLLRPMASSSKRGWAYAFATFSGVTGLMAYEFRRRSAVELQRFEAGREALETFTPTEIFGKDAANYPW